MVFQLIRRHTLPNSSSPSWRTFGLGVQELALGKRINESYWLIQIYLSQSHHCLTMAYDSCASESCIELQACRTCAVLPGLSQSCDLPLSQSTSRSYRRQKHLVFLWPTSQIEMFRGTFLRNAWWPLLAPSLSWLRSSAERHMACKQPKTETVISGIIMHITTNVL